MSDIVAYQENLPDNLQDLASFVLVGREKLTAVRAEIRAINKLKLAEEVRQQKMEEARMLSEALLDAEVRIGELTKRIPKADKGNQYTGKMVNRNNANNHFQEFSQPTKAQAMTEIGFNKDQVSRFETLADNKDLVEQVKAEARERNTIPTRGKVLDLAKARRQQNEPQTETINVYKEIDRRADAAGAFHKALTGIAIYNVKSENLENFIEFFPEDAVEKIPEYCDQGIVNLQLIKAMYTGRYAKHGNGSKNQGNY